LTQHAYDVDESLNWALAPHERVVRDWWRWLVATVAGLPSVRTATPDPLRGRLGAVWESLAEDDRVLVLELAERLARNSDVSSRPDHAPP
jgi:hypothetical protein